MDALGVDPDELDPCPDIHALFQHYNDLYFGNSLGACSVQWSSGRMTLCAGVCQYQRGGGCTIKLSEPLLKYRPPRDLKDTLLHEMIHAQLFLTGVRDDGDHGPRFRERMGAINNSKLPDPQRPAGGYHITVFHSLHDEVAAYRKHIWVCSRCGHSIARASNRRPQPADCRHHVKPPADCQDPTCTYHLHLRTCGGEYDKVAEPDPPPASNNKKRSRSSTPNASTTKAAAAAGSGPSTSAPGALTLTSGSQARPGGGSTSIRDFFTPAAAAGAAAAARAAAAASGSAPPAPQPGAAEVVGSTRSSSSSSQAGAGPAASNQGDPPSHQQQQQHDTPMQHQQHQQHQQQGRLPVPPRPQQLAGHDGEGGQVLDPRPAAAGADTPPCVEEEDDEVVVVGVVAGPGRSAPAAAAAAAHQEGRPPPAGPRAAAQQQPAGSGRQPAWCCPVCAAELCAGDWQAVNTHLDACLALMAAG